MAKVRRTSTDNIFGNKGSVRPRQKSGDKESSQEVMSINDTFVEAPEEPAEATVPAENQENYETAAQPAKEQKTSDTPNSMNNLDTLFKRKKGYGKTKSVYFQQDVLDYCNSVSKKYGVTFSEVINKFIRTYMEEE